MARVTSRLERWADLDDGGWSALLLGNGASIVVSSRFQYASLLQEAALSPGDRAVFKAMETTNFETVLDGLRIARLVCRQEGHREADVRRRYVAIRRALIRAVNRIHPSHATVPIGTLRKIAGVLRRYEWVFSANYDLLVYWAIMSVGARGFRDYFWGNGLSFDAADTDVANSLTKLLFLHGALHLYRDDLGRAAKRAAQPGGILRSVGRTGVPLFVSEGRPADKLRAIHRSDYLSYAHASFADCAEPIVVFGQSLGTQDQHLIPALNQRRRRVALSLLGGSDRSVIRRKAELRDLLPKANLTFFDAGSHPLGDPALRLAP